MAERHPARSDFCAEWQAPRSFPRTALTAAVTVATHSSLFLTSLVRAEHRAGIYSQFSS